MMALNLRDLIKFGLLLVLLLGIAILVTSIQKRNAAPREFHGILLYRVAHIGGEGGIAGLATSDGGYDLFFDRDQRTNGKLRALNRKKVVVVGRSRVVHGIERKSYRAIDVIDLKAE